MGLTPGHLILAPSTGLFRHHRNLGFRARGLASAITRAVEECPAAGAGHSFGPNRSGAGGHSLGRQLFLVEAVEFVQ
ncbi:hypothetical protein SAMN05216554_0570 [Herbiconiux ginsengi]|uniref:Uncharacterized protein n=1 Tax=Herbiconiux ginsengi TaxID=381665 RepID=A0A1H3KI14_9MICO|nr:hypothetical protein SAMN05216554_0570 [Herbiconiux ginsengi]